MDTRKVQFGQFPLFAFQFPLILLTVCLFWSIGASTVRGQTTIQFLDITSTGSTSVKIEYRVTGAAFPTNSWPGKEPYWVLLRSTVDGGTSGEEDQRELIPASKRTVGDHEIVKGATHKITGLIETTQKFDVLGRSTHQTRWLAALGQIDRQDPPSAGYNGISASSGLSETSDFKGSLTRFSVPAWGGPRGRHNPSRLRQLPVTRSPEVLSEG